VGESWVDAPDALLFERRFPYVASSVVNTHRLQ
jgi:hypothetical protein